jgi:uncharacterized Zn finger protein
MADGIRCPTCGSTLTRQVFILDGFRRPDYRECEACGAVWRNVELPELPPLITPNT